MAIQFNNIPPSNQRVPLWYAEINGAQTPYVSISRLLLLGQMNNLGGATPGLPVRWSGDPRTQFGQNSMLADMCLWSRKNAPFQEIWALPMMDSAVGVAATGTVKLPRGLTARVATTASIANLATSAPLVVDGQTLLANDLVLVKDQANPALNGLYVVTTPGTGVNGVWTRATSMDTADEFENYLVVSVTAGTISAGLKYRLYRGLAPVTVGTTPISFTLGGMITAAMTLALWVGDVQVSTITYPTDTGATLAARLNAAINAAEGCPVTSTVTAETITLTARHKGTAGNSIYLDCDYYGVAGPMANSLFTLTQMSGGTGDPDFTTALASLGDDEYDWMVGPYSDPVFLALMNTLLNGSSGRWSPASMLYGHYLGIYYGTPSAAMTYGVTQNDPTCSIFNIYRAGSPSWKWAAALGGRIAAHLTEPPELSRPLQSLDLIGILPPKDVANRPDKQTRNALYFSGISSYHVDGPTRVCSIDRIITTYQRNEWNSPDYSWLDIETRAQAMYAIRSMRAAVTGNYGRCALMDDNPEGLQGVATVKDIRSTVVHEYKRLWKLGVVDNPDLFEAQLIVERNTVDFNRVDIYLPADVVNQLRIVAVNYTSFLQYPQAA